MIWHGWDAPVIQTGFPYLLAISLTYLHAALPGVQTASTHGIARMTGAWGALHRMGSALQSRPLTLLCAAS